MSGGSTKTQTQQQTAKSDPWSPAQPALQNILTGATSAYDATGGQAPVYTGQRVAGLGDTTQAGLAQMASGAAAGAPTASAGNDFVAGLLGNGGATAATSAATANYAGIDPTVSTAGVQRAAGSLNRAAGMAGAVGAGLASGAYGTDTGALTGMANGLASGPTQTRTSLQRVADGADLNGSPQLDALIARSQNDAASKVAQSMAASGRYGSGRFAAATADAVDNVGTSLRYQDLQNQQARQASAASAIDSADNARAGTAGSLYSTLSGINQGNAGLAVQGANLGLTGANAALTGQQTLYGDQSDNTNRALSQASTLLSGAQSDRAAGLAGISALPTVQAALTQPGQTLAGVGAAQDEARQNQLDADQSLFNDQANAKWKALANYAGLVDPIAGLGGTSNGTSTTTVPQASLLQQLVGTGLAGASVASRFFKPV